MDWSPLSRYPGGVRIAVGLLLLANPLVVAEFDLGDPDWYRYEAAEITFDEDGVVVPLGVGIMDPDVICLEQVERRVCMLEYAIHANGGIEYDGLPRPFLSHDYSFVYVYGEGFFKTVEEERDGTVWYGLRPVDRERALDRVATDVERASGPVRRAIRDGSVETSDELPGANELVAADGYYVVHDVAHHETSGERAPHVLALQWVLGAAGLGLVLRGQRIRVEGRAV